MATGAIITSYDKMSQAGGKIQVYFCHTHFHSSWIFYHILKSAISGNLTRAQAQTVLTTPNDFSRMEDAVLPTLCSGGFPAWSG